MLEFGIIPFYKSGIEFVYNCIPDRDDVAFYRALENTQRPIPVFLHQLIELLDLSAHDGAVEL